MLKILKPEGRELAYTAAYYEKSGKVLSMRGWVLDPKGDVQEIRQREAAEASATSFELYSDTKVKVLQAEKADVGSIVAFEVEQREQPYEDRALWRFQGTLPVVRARFELNLPEGVEFTETHVGRTSVRPLRAEARTTWEIRDVPAIEDEPRMPSPSALAAWMGVSWDRRRTWSDVAGWFAMLASTRLASTPELAAKAKELGDLRACARFAQLDVRYVAVEIGIGGYQPHHAADVFRNRFGDCKDKATLLRTMLKERGIDSHYVLVHTTRGMTEPSFPTIAAFNHVIVAVRENGKLTFFDPTSTTTPYGLLPVLRGTVEETRTGSIAADFRGYLQPLNAAERVRFVEQSLAHHLGHHTTADVKIEQLDDPAVPLVIRYSIVTNDYATRGPDLLRYRRRYTMKALTVPPAEVGALNEAFAKVAADERASAVFK